MGFIRLPGSPHLSPSVRPQSGSSSSSTAPGHGRPAPASNSPGPSPYLLPRSPAIRSSSRTRPKGLFSSSSSTSSTNGSSASHSAHHSGSSSTGSSTSSFANKFRSSKSGTTPTSSPKILPASSSAANASPIPKSPALGPLTPRSPALRPTSSTSATASPSLSASTPAMVAQPPPPPIKLSFSIESPPLLMIGTHTESTGALLSGLFTLNVFETTPVPLRSVHISIIQNVRVNIPQQPSSGHHHHLHHSPSFTSTSSPDIPPFGNFFPAACLTCADCLTHTTELARWDVLAAPNKLPRGAHAYPFSHLVPGSVPATSTNPVYTVAYKLIAIAVPDTGFPGGRSPNKPYTIEMPLDIKRAIVRGPDRASVRVFPPTDLVAHISMPNVTYPESTIPLEISLDGVSICSEKNAQNGRKTRWRMRKLNWRIDETCKMRAARCPKHESAPLSKKARSMSSSSTSSSSSRTAAATGHGSVRGGGGSSAAAANGGSPQLGFASRRGSSNAPSTTSTPLMAPPPAVTITRQSPLLMPHSGTPRSMGAAINGGSTVPSSPLGTPLHPHTQSPRHGPLSFSQSPVSGGSTPAPVAANGNDGAAASSQPNARASPSLREIMNQDFDFALEQRLQQEQERQQELEEQQQQPPQPIENPSDIVVEHQRIMCGGEIKSGWKTDFTGKGKIELLAELPTVHVSHKLSSNISDPTYGLELSHMLVIEIVVAEELVPNKGHYQATLTGAARVLRMQFNLLVTDRSGLGIAWDDEVPPRYSDVPLSPPDYENVAGDLPRIEDLVLSDDGEDFETARSHSSEAYETAKSRSEESSIYAGDL